MRLSERVFEFFFLAYGLSIGLVILVQLSNTAGGIDDPYYYLKIAEHLAHGEGSTFDGIHLTNGYHPLWLLSLVPLFGITSNPDTTRSFATALLVIIFACSIVIYYRASRLILTRIASIFSALLWALFTYRQSFSGLEFGVYALGIALVGWAWLRIEGAGLRSWRFYFVLGVYCALTFLARSDAILLAALVGASLMWREWRAGWPRGVGERLSAFGLPVIILVVGYATVNWFLVGHLIPVSSVVKQHWSDYYLTEDPIYLEQGWLPAKLFSLLLPIRVLPSLSHPLDMIYPFCLSVGGLGAGMIALAQIPPFGARADYWLGNQVRTLMPLLLYGFLSLLAYVILFHEWITYAQNWYYAVQPWLTAFLAGIFLVRLSELGAHYAVGSLYLQSSARIAILVLVCAIPIYTFRQLGAFKLNNASIANESNSLQDAAHWLAANTPQDAIVGSWSAGIIGFYSERRVINLDGLVNSWDYFEHEQYDLCAYWKNNNITYLADVFQNDIPFSPDPAFLYYAPCADRLRELWKEELPDHSRQTKIFKIEW